ncbi:MAG TPA: WecB/TagA/CpsF family glycosyltransferase [Terriglobales bacterium]|nr:WecB/TagA/CpsF family glycosyltransferase [Terriglobales bacterium]
MRSFSDAQLPLANVLGVGVSAINMAEALRLSDRLLQEHGKGYICVTGVHGVMESQRDGVLRDILNRSFLCLPDGMPTVWVGRLQGHRTMGRVYGPDFMLQLCELSARRDWRHFLYGGKRGVAEKAAGAPGGSVSRHQHCWHLHSAVPAIDSY